MRKPNRSKKSKGKRTSKRATRKTLKIRRKGNQDSPKTTLCKLRKLAAKAAKVLTPEEQAERDFENARKDQERLIGWKALKKTWTRGSIARYKANKYVSDLANRIVELNKKTKNQQIFVESV